MFVRGPIYLIDMPTPFYTQKNEEMKREVCFFWLTGASPRPAECGRLGRELPTLANGASAGQSQAAV